MLTGNCLCGAIQYQVDIEDKVDAIIFCHCKRCRQWNGSAFNSAVAIKTSTLTILTGQNQLKVFSFNGVNRYFCGECGGNMFTSRDNNKEFYRLRIGTLNDPIYPKQKIHIYTDSKANWETICDDGQQFSEGLN